MRNLNIYPFNNFLIYYTLPLAIVIILYITSLVLIYLITESLCILITFFQYPPMLSTSINHKSGLFFHEFFFVCLFRFHIFMKSCSICLSLTYFASHNALMVFQMVEFPCVFFFFFLLFRATPSAYVIFQARGPLRAAAAGLHHSHRNLGSEWRPPPAP